MSRLSPPPSADERTMLVSWLDFHRTTLAKKCAGLTPQQLATRSVPPSELSLLGLVRHMAEVERGWFVRRVAGIDAPRIYGAEADESDQDADFHLPVAEPAELAALAALVDQAFAAWRAEVIRADEILAGVANLDVTFRHERGGEISVRWLLVHMIEEYARHNGHADLLREAIDGVTGE
jgi:uncharacterized damage-inducible protein DinB